MPTRPAFALYPGMLLPILALLLGLVALIWSADRFVDGASGVARYLGMPPLLIGIIIVGFGTSAPEMIVSAIAALQNNPGLALGNAYGSNIANIALILGVTALISPVGAHSQILRRELPVLTAITLLSIYLLWDLEVSLLDGIVMLLVFALIMGWSSWQGMKGDADPLAAEFTKEIESLPGSLGSSVLWLLIGLAVLVASSRSMVWGAVEIALSLCVSDLVIGLTIVAVGTSLPELASSIAAARKQEHDIVIGNVIGSNMFNTLAVVGIASVINPFQTASAILTRDLPVVACLTLSLFVFCYRPEGHGRINRVEGAILLSSFVAYNLWVFLAQQ